MGPLPPPPDWRPLVLDHPLEIVLGLLALASLIFAMLSLGWTTRHSRRILGQSLGRRVRKDEESSLAAWMNVPDEQLDAGARELERNPFEPAVRLLDKVADTMHRHGRER